MSLHGGKVPGAVCGQVNSDVPNAQGEVPNLQHQLSDTCYAYGW